MMPMVRQRAKRDCGVAALTMVAGVDYEDTWRACAGVDARWQGQEGLHNHELLAVAAALGVTLTPARRYDLDAEVGVLRVRWTGDKARVARGGHFVAVRYGLIFDPATAYAYPWREYVARYRPRLCTLLRRTA